MKNNKVVYIHRKKSDDTIFYVGMGNSYRPYDKHKSKRSRYWLSTVNKNGYYVEVLFEGLSAEEAFEIEIYLISKFGRKDKGLGPLVNLSDGGEGVSGGLGGKAKSVYNIYTGEFFSTIREAHESQNEIGYSKIVGELRGLYAISDENPFRYLDNPYPEADRLWESIRENEVPFDDGFDCVDDRESIAEFTSVEQDALDRLNTLPKRTLDIILMVEDTSLRKTAKHYNLGVTCIYNSIKSIKAELLGDTQNWKYSTKLVPKSFYTKPDKPKAKKVKVKKPKVKRVDVKKVELKNELYKRRVTRTDKIKEAIRLYNELASITPSSGSHEQN